MAAAISAPSSSLLCAPTPVVPIESSFLYYHSPPPQVLHPRIARALEKYARIGAQELSVLHQLRQCEIVPSSPEVVRHLLQELQLILSSKISEMKSLEDVLDPVAEISSASWPCGILPEQPKAIHAPPTPNRTISPPPLIPSPKSESSFQPTASSVPLNVEEQPTGNVIANKYLEPPLVVRVNEKYKDLAKEGKLQIQAQLCLSHTDEIVTKTLDSKQDILQGQTIVSVTSEGYATFNKLKIMEVSSKHHHQAFSIKLQLQYVVSSTQEGRTVKPIQDPIKLSPLHVQSRINKRKRSCLGQGRANKRPRGESDCTYVDITPLLVLPQKEAAVQLGISESMLCKRFKECTRRKWPYRYLRKIDKMIKYLTNNKKNDIPQEDLEKIHKLQKEREECLHPVKIRITGSDKLTSCSTISTKDSNLKCSGGSPDEGDSEEEDMESDQKATESETETSISSPQGITREEFHKLAEEDEEIAQVASTLNLLKQAVQ